MENDTETNEMLDISTTSPDEISSVNQNEEYVDELTDLDYWATEAKQLTNTTKEVVNILLGKIQANPSMKVLEALTGQMNNLNSVIKTGIKINDSKANIKGKRFAQALKITPIDQDASTISTDDVLAIINAVRTQELEEKIVYSSKADNIEDAELNELDNILEDMESSGEFTDRSILEGSLVNASVNNAELEDLLQTINEEFVNEERAKAGVVEVQEREVGFEPNVDEAPSW